MPNPIHVRRDPVGSIGARLKRDASGLWRFENSANLGLDSSPKGNHLTNNNSVPQVTPGKVGAAAGFTAASSQYLSIADNAAISLDTASAFTIQAWFYLADNTAQHYIAGKWQSGGNIEFFLRHLTATSRISFSVGNGAGTAISQDATSFGAPTVNTWHHLLAWWDGAFVYIQINGGTINSTAYTGTIPATAFPFRLGAGDSAGAAATFWQGNLDECALWKRVLTATERAWLYNSGQGRSLA